MWYPLFRQPQIKQEKLEIEARSEKTKNMALMARSATQNIPKTAKQGVAVRIFCLRRWAPATPPKEFFALRVVLESSEVPVVGVAKTHQIRSRRFRKISWPGFQIFQVKHTAELAALKIMDPICIEFSDAEFVALRIEYPKADESSYSP